MAFQFGQDFKSDKQSVITYEDFETMSIVIETHIDKPCNIEHCEFCIKNTDMYIKCSGAPNFFNGRFSCFNCSVCQSSFASFSFYTVVNFQYI